MAKSITRARFHLYTTGARSSIMPLVCDEMSYWADLDETIIGTVIHDLADSAYGWIMLARDRIGRFRAFKVATDIPTERRAMAQLRLAIAETTLTGDFHELGVQGDEPPTAFDLLEVSEETDRRLIHPYFRELIERPARAPARAVLKELSPWVASSDSDFVRAFQQDQFDQRLWEIYLWAAFRELGLDVKRPDPPDFVCRAPGGSFTVEATTTAPSQEGPLADHPNPQTTEEMAFFLNEYMPMKFGSSLMSKLDKTYSGGKHYWDLSQVKGKPFILAIADFHKPATDMEVGSMLYTQSALWRYLYGYRVAWEVQDGRLVFQSAAVSSHSYGGKVVPSGFFDLPGAENISAVLFSNAGTIAKFDRMGVVAGFAEENYKYFRMGNKLDPDPSAVVGERFFVDVRDPSYEEYWSDELQLFHNPNAANPIPSEWFSGIMQYFFKGEDLVSFGPDHHILSSITTIIGIVD